MILFLFVGNNCNVFAVKMYYRKDKPMSATSAFTTVNYLHQALVAFACLYHLFIYTLLSE